MKRLINMFGVGLMGLALSLGSLSLAACGDDDDDDNGGSPVPAAEGAQMHRSRSAVEREAKGGPGVAPTGKYGASRATSMPTSRRTVVVAAARPSDLSKLLRSSRTRGGTRRRPRLAATCHGGGK